MNILLILAVAGVILALLPMDERYKQLLYVAAVILFIIWLIGILGSSLSSLRAAIAMSALGA